MVLRGPVTHVLMPFALAYGAWVGDERLTADAAALPEVAPASSGSLQARALVAQFGGGLRLRTGRQQQGAWHLYRHSRTLRRCHECSVARLGREEG